MALSRLSNVIRCGLALQPSAREDEMARQNDPICAKNAHTMHALTMYQIGYARDSGIDSYLPPVVPKRTGQMPRVTSAGLPLAGCGFVRISGISARGWRREVWCPRKIRLGG